MHEREPTPKAIDAIRDHLRGTHGHTDFDLLRDVAYVGNNPAAAVIVYLPESGFAGARFECKDTACAGLIFPAEPHLRAPGSATPGCFWPTPSFLRRSCGGHRPARSGNGPWRTRDRGGMGQREVKADTPAARSPLERPTGRRSTSGANAASSSFWRRCARGRGSSTPSRPWMRFALRIRRHMRGSWADRTSAHPRRSAEILERHPDRGAQRRPRRGCPGPGPPVPLRDLSRRTRSRSGGRRMHGQTPLRRGMSACPSADVRVSLCRCPRGVVSACPGDICGCPRGGHVRVTSACSVC